MSLIVGLMILGFALIMIEIFVPGGIVGAIGGLCLLAAVVLSFREFGGQGALVAFLVGVVGLAGCLYLELKVFPKTRAGQRVFLGARIEGKSQGDFGRPELVGKHGSALTALAPSGYVLVEGVKLEASSRSGFLEKGERVRVDSYDQFKVTVSKAS